MTFLIAILSSIVVFSVYTYIMYNQSFKESVYLYPVGILLGIGISVCWLSLVRYSDSKETLFLYSIIWDVIVAATALFIPILFYHVKFSPLSWVGIGLIVVGVVVLEIASLC